MWSQYGPLILHLGSAWLAGSLIGLERSFHGRPAGFRTHALVCLASALLMLLTAHQDMWLTNGGAEAFRSDPTRMAQGIMTGIGFLGAGVIFKEGLTVRGLTTSASIWMTAALGILYGIGFWVPAVLATVAVLATLAGFRWIESHMPSEFFAHHVIRFPRDRVLSEGELTGLLRDCGFTVSNLSYRLDGEDTAFEYRMVLRTLKRDNIERLALRLRSRDDVIDFRLSPASN